MQFLRFYLMLYFYPKIPAAIRLTLTGCAHAKRNDLQKSRKISTI